MSSPTMTPPKQPPPLNIPPSTDTVKVSIINTGTVANMPISILLKPADLGGFTHGNLPSYSFLIEHQSGRKLLFDLSVRKDWKNMAPSAVKQITDANVDMRIDKDVYDILSENGSDPKAVEAIFWSRK
jgi:hypothetical protein